ncbi:hypothetical protein EP7_002184 [Isosphaeraceae bacterium EP7]
MNTAGTPPDYRIADCREFPFGLDAIRHDPKLAPRCSITNCRGRCSFRFLLLGLGMIGHVGVCSRHFEKYGRSNDQDGLVAAVAAAEAKRLDARRERALKALARRSSVKAATTP